MAEVSAREAIQDLISHLMIDHGLDAGKLPNPTLDELIDLHRRQPHHEYVELPSRLTPREQSLRHLGNRIDTAAGRDRSREQRATEGGDIYADLAQHEREYGKDEESTEIRFRILTELLNASPDRARKAIARHTPGGR